MKIGGTSPEQKTLAEIGKPNKNRVAALRTPAHHGEIMGGEKGFFQHQERKKGQGGGGIRIVRWDAPRRSRCPHMVRHVRERGGVGKNVKGKKKSK